MKKIKITVLKRDFDPILAKEFTNSTTEHCPRLKVGDEFIAGFEQPENFCGWAWNDINRFVVAMLSGGNFSKGEFEGWMKNEKEMIACCTDGVRPITFKLELIEVN
jgi:uncharacterized repeat protein (TIGR04076 family)